MRILAALILLVSPEVSAAQDWHGYWTSDIAYCQYKDLVGQHDPAPVLFSKTEIVGLENRCMVRSATPIGQLPAWRLELACSGEGTTYDAERILMLSEDDRLWEFDGLWEPFGYIRCE